MTIWHMDGLEIMQCQMKRALTVFAQVTVILSQAQTASATQRWHPEVEPKAPCCCGDAAQNTQSCRQKHPRATSDTGTET